MIVSGGGGHASYVSDHAPGVLGKQLAHNLAGPLSDRGYRLVAEGPAGLAFRREPSGKRIAVVAGLGLLGLGWLGSGGPEIVLGLVAFAVAAWLLWSHRPRRVELALRPDGQGTMVLVSGDRDLVDPLITLDARRSG